MTPTVIVLIALAAGEALALVKVRKQNKRLVRLERKTKGDAQDVGGGRTYGIKSRICVNSTIRKPWLIGYINPVRGCCAPAN